MENNYLLLSCFYCATLLLACSLTICTPQIQLQPANIDLKVSQTVNAGTCISCELLHSQLQNDVEEILNSSIIPQFFVKLEQVLQVIQVSSRVIHYGMARVALALVPAVNSTIPHGSVSSYPSLLYRRYWNTSTWSC